MLPWRWSVQERPSGKRGGWSFLLLPMVFLAQSSCQVDAGMVPPLAQGPWQHHLAPPLGVLPHQGPAGLGLHLPSWKPHPRLGSLAALLPLPRTHFYKAERKARPPSKKSLLLPPLFNILDCEAWLQLLPLRSPWQPDSIPSPSLNPSSSSARGASASPLTLPQRVRPNIPQGARGEEEWGPQSSAPSSSTWGAPGVSWGSGF